MVILSAHVLEKKIMGIEIPVNSIVKHPFLIEETPSVGYVDISSVYSWWHFGRDLGKDYLYIRERIKESIIKISIENCADIRSTPPLIPVVNEYIYIDKNKEAEGSWKGREGWVTYWTTEWNFEPATWLGYRSLQNIEEKRIAASLKIGSQADHFKDWGIPTIVNHGYTYHKNSIVTRTDRLHRAVVEVYNIIPANTAEALSNLVASPLGNMYYRFLEFGIKGSVEDYDMDFNPNPTPGILDWIMSRPPFSGETTYLDMGFPTGLTKKDWYPIDNSSIEEFADKLYNILYHGEYETTDTIVDDNSSILETPIFPEII